jgi:branched-chain amino acid transport system substrate-binding protein
MRKSIWILAFVVLGVLLFPNLFNSTTTRAQDGAIRIGVINSTTGLFADQGKLVQNGILLARDDINANGGINGRKIELVFEDDGSDARRAVKAFQKLAASKVQVIIGPLSSGATMATATLADRYGIPQVVPTAHSANLRGLSRNVFLIYPNNNQEARYIAEVATKKLNKKRVAVLMPDNQFSGEFSTALARYVRGNGGTVVADQRFRESTTDFSAIVTGLRRYKPDVLVIPSYLPVAPVAILREVARQKLAVSVIAGGAACSVALLSLQDLVLPPDIKSNIFFVNETFDRGQRSTSMQQFMDSYQRHFDTAPQPYSAMGNSAVYVVTDAIAKAGSTRGGLQRALSNTNIDTAFGTVKFDASQVNAGVGFSLYQLNREPSAGAKAGQLVLVQ